MNSKYLAVLQFIKYHEPTSWWTIRKKFEDSDSCLDFDAILKDLNSEGYISYSSEKDVKYYSLTFKGREFFHSCKQETFRFWIPVIISSVLSVIAIVISIIALLK